MFYRDFEKFRLVSIELGQDFSHLHLSIDKKGDVAQLSSVLAKGIEKCKGRRQLERFLDRYHAFTQ